MKTIKRYKTGLRKQHVSLMSVETFVLGDNPTQAEFEELDNALKDEPKTDEEAITLLYQFVCSVMEDKAKELGIKKDTEINHRNAIDYGPVFFSGTNAMYGLKQALEAKRRGDKDAAFSWLLDVIPALLSVQLLANEALIIAGRSRTSTAGQRKSANKQKDMALAKPYFEKHLKAGKSIVRAAELAARDIEKIEGKKIPKATIKHYYYQHWNK